MEKIIKIDDKEIRLKSTAATPLHYKRQFGRDYFADLSKLSGTKKKGKIDMDYLDMEVIYNIIWVLAKTGDDSIPDVINWLDQFDTMPIKEIMPEVQEMIISTISSKKK